MTKKWYEEWQTQFPPLDIEHATKREVYGMLMMALNHDEEVRLRKRYHKLEMDKDDPQPGRPIK
ncbi:hypothetical protein [Lactiplantibacillus carotarum]|uniref:hypothetical protein n=1 Tax=Lactiplantibacillus carotarum TaxID=2993456 RepID=UPI00298EE603|nr:hypothetical protein [Lactiplantibacillus carotarum]